MPVEYDRPSITEAICADLAEGLSLRQACAKDGRPNKSTFLRWLEEEGAGELRDQYARARERQAELMGDEILEIADDASNDWMVREGKAEEDSAFALNGEHVQRSRLRIDSRKWLMSKLAPKKYGDKVSIGGDENAAPIRVLQTIERQIVRPKSNNPDC